MIRVRRVAAFARARGAFARRATPTSTRSSASLVARNRRDLASRARSVGVARGRRRRRIRAACRGL
jgi:hypothetical protein